MKELTKEQVELKCYKHTAYLVTVHGPRGEENHVIVGPFSHAVDLRAKFVEEGLDVQDIDLCAVDLWGYVEK